MSKEISKERMREVIKIRSFWKIDGRKGDYKLPSGDYLSSYVGDLLSQQMAIDGLEVDSDLNCKPYDEKLKSFIIPYGENKIISDEEIERNFYKLVRYIISGKVSKI